MDSPLSFDLKESPEEEKLENGNEAIGQIFENHGVNGDDFSLTEITQQADSSISKPFFEPECDPFAHSGAIDSIAFNKYLDCHHKSAYPLVHHPLRPIYHKKKPKEKNHSTAQEELLLTENNTPSELVELEQDDDNALKVQRSMSLPCETPNIQPSSILDNADSQIERKPFTMEPDLNDESCRSRERQDTLCSALSTDDELTETSTLLSPISAIANIQRLKPCIRSETEASEDDMCSMKKGRVKFELGCVEDAKVPTDKQFKHRKRKTRRKRTYDDPKALLHTGDETPVKHSFFAYTEDETQLLNESELNEISTHRFEAKAVRRRHSVKTSLAAGAIIHPSKIQSKEKGDRSVFAQKKIFDHKPHEVFVELAELQHSTCGDLEWKETARWIKYEEDVQGVDERWGKPKIPFLNFNALFSLRKGIERGAVLLDLEEKDIGGVATRVVDHLVSNDQIESEHRDAVINILLLRHKHIKEQHHTFKLSSRESKTHLSGTPTSDEIPSVTSAASMDTKSHKINISNFFHSKTFSSLGQAHVDHVTENVVPVSNGKKYNRGNSYMQIEIESDNESQQRKKGTENSELLKKLPENAEATAVLVGAVDFLQQPSIAFVRLAEGVVMENVVEVSIPVRFLFVLLGPCNVDTHLDNAMDYHEVGRAISTLMSDKSFHEIAYRAHTRGQLLNAINDFLNASIVFPPSEWNDDNLVPIDEIKVKAREILRKNEDLKNRKKSAALLKKSEMLEDSKVDALDRTTEEKRDPLQRKGRLFYGLVQDVKMRYSKYRYDITDGFSSQVLSACIFIFFASLSPTITFGGIYADSTDRYIGVGETLLVTSINGAIFALLAAQPLIIVGSTGPLMTFDLSLLQFCESMDLDFLSIRVWVGIWLFILGLLVAAFELVSVVKKFTRFTEEIFSSLVCLIFVYGSIKKLVDVFKRNPLTGGANTLTSGVDEDIYSSFGNLSLSNIPNFNASSTNTISNIASTVTSNIISNITSNITSPKTSAGENEPNTALLSMCLMLGTFYIAWKLKFFRNSKYLGRNVRRALGDFGVPISIFLMVTLDWLIRDIYTDKLSMPKGLQPSNAKVRGWFINPLGAVKPLPVWCIFAACPAALLLFVLIFLEVNICHLILSKPERCLKKGSGFHLDIVLSCFINTVSGFLGAPFMGPACVRTIAHMSSLTVMSTNTAPGEPPKIIGCIEQRVSALTVSILVGLSVMLYSVLNLVPVAVLLGVFLYMGISATAGIQLLERCILLLMPVKHHPNVPYVNRVRTFKMHAFTAIQIVMLVILWIVKQSPAALAMPFVLMCLIPIRLYALPLLFTDIELVALDGKEQAALDEPDFYETAHNLPIQIEKNHTS